MNENFGDMLSSAMSDCQGSSAFSMHRNRPYDGQAHTHNGVRGAEEVLGLTMRDVVDCMVRGFLRSTGEPPMNKAPVHDDLYKLDLEKLDPGAIIQNTVCEIEKMTGIYPNLPGRVKELDLIQESDGIMSVPLNPVTKTGDVVEINYDKYLVLRVNRIYKKGIMLLTVKEGF